jgi:hypothetical protein
VAQAQRGVDVRQAGPLLFDASFVSSSTGAPVTTGSASAQLFEVQSDGSLKAFDFSTNLFIVAGSNPVTATIALTQQATGSGATASGYWSAVLSTTTALTPGGIYLITYTVPAGAAPYAMRKIQFGLAEGDISVDTLGRIDVGKILGTASAGAAGFMGIDWGHVNAPTTAVALSGTTIGTVTTYTGNTPQTGDNFARIGALGAGLTALAQASALTSLTTTVGAAGAGLTGIPFTGVATSSALASLVTTVGTPAQASALTTLTTTVGASGAGLTAVAVAPTGLDAVVGWGTFSLKQTIRGIYAAVAGKRSGVPLPGVAGTITLVDNAAVAYGTITVDTGGNITASSLSPPSA